MNRLVLMIFYLLPLLLHAQEANITFSDGSGRGDYVDSLKLKIIERRVYCGAETREGYELQKSAGLDARKLSQNIDLGKMSVMAEMGSYADSIQIHNPDIKVPMQHVYPQTARYQWQRNMFANDYNQEGVIARWYGGDLTGYSGFSTTQMIGSTGYAGAYATQHFGDRWTAQAGFQLSKFTGLYSTLNSYTANGILTYTANKNVSFSAFGTYNSSPFLSSAQGYAGSLNYGGYMTLKTNNDKWGVDLGAQGYRDMMSGRNAVVPVIRPFYNLNGQKLGFDVGGILYQLFRNMSIKANGSGGYDGSNMPANMRPVRVPTGARGLGFEHQRGRKMGNMHP